MSEQVGERKARPVQGGHDQARVLRGFEERGGERPDGTHARSRIFHPLAHPSLPLIFS